MHKRPIIDLHAEAFTTFVDVPSEEVNETNYKDYYCEFPIYDVIELTKETYEPQKYYYKVDEDWYFLDFDDFDPTRTYYEIVDYRYDAATIYSLATVYFKKINGFEVFENEYSREQHGESLLTYHVNPEMGMYELVKNNLKPDALSLYRFALDYDEILKTYLYKEQIFESDTDKKDIKVGEDSMDRSLTSRLTTNNFLNHERDFKWYVQNELLYYFDKERDKDFVPVLKHMTWKSN
jgi:hypothetical protein